MIERHGQLGFSWVSDSRGLWERSDRKPLRRTDLYHVLVSKANRSVKSQSKGLVRHSFASGNDQINSLQSAMTGPRNEWIIFDSTFMSAQRAYTLCRSFMGCLAYCGANKAPWTDFDLCRELYEQAKRERTFLCLNCIQGVWLDQMEYVPAVVSNLEDGKLNITKRDNPSINFFYEKIRKGISPSQAFKQIGEQGYLEPNATDLLPEVKDQWIKGRITQNFCSILSGIKLGPINELSRMIPNTTKPEEVAYWHSSRRNDGNYPAITTEVEIGLSTISLSIAFVDLPATHPLATNFPGKNALSVHASDARFTWTRPERSRRSGSFSHSGFGGARRTADKLIWEAERASKLSDMKRKAEFDPIPIIWGARVR